MSRKSEDTWLALSLLGVAAGCFLITLQLWALFG